MSRLRRNQVCTSRNWKPTQREILSKDAGPFIKTFSFSRCFSHIFAIANQLAGFSISRLASVEDFFKFLNVNIYASINDYLFKYLYLASQQTFVLMKTSWRRLSSSSSRRLQGVLKTSCKNVFKTSSRRLQDILKTSSRRRQDFFKTSSRRLQDIFKTFCQDVFKMSCKNVIKTSSWRLPKMSSRRFQDASSG